MNTAKEIFFGVMLVLMLVLVAPFIFELVGFLIVLAIQVFVAYCLISCIVGLCTWAFGSKVEDDKVYAY